MNIASIRILCERYDIDDLKKAEENLLDEKIPEIEVPGSDAGEQLTHILAAIWIREEMQESGCDITTAIRNYSKKVRKSIS